MNNIKEKWRELSLPARTAYILAAVLFVSIPVEGLIFESFNMVLIDFNIIAGLYVVSVAVSFLTRQWKLMLFVSIGGIIIFAVTIGVSEVLWYYLKLWFGIDISYR